MVRHVGKPPKPGLLIFERDAFTCIYCEVQSHDGMVPLCMDHVYPNRFYEADCAANIITACRKCNILKSDRRLDYDKETRIHGIICARNDAADIPANYRVGMNGRWGFDEEAVFGQIEFPPDPPYVPIVRPPSKNAAIMNKRARAWRENQIGHAERVARLRLICSDDFVPSVGGL